jgi:hypothetical protein
VVRVIFLSFGALNGFADTSPHPQACLDIPIRHELPSFLIEEWQNRYDDVRSAIVAENQIL